MDKPAWARIGQNHLTAARLNHGRLRTSIVSIEPDSGPRDPLPVRLMMALERACQGYRTTRSELGEVALPHVIDATLRASRTEGRRLAATAHAISLAERSLRGEVFVPHL